MAREKLAYRYEGFEPSLHGLTSEYIWLELQAKKRFEDKQRFMMPCPECGASVGKRSIKCPNCKCVLVPGEKAA